MFERSVQAVFQFFLIKPRYLVFSKTFKYKILVINSLITLFKNYALESHLVAKYKRKLIILMLLTKFKYLEFFILTHSLASNKKISCQVSICVSFPVISGTKLCKLNFWHKYFSKVFQKFMRKMSRKIYHEVMTIFEITIIVLTIVIFILVFVTVVTISITIRTIRYIHSIKKP